MASNAAGSVQDAASSAASAVQQAPDTVIRQAQGNPLAAGLIAFGVGWLVSSLLPVSEKETQLAQQAESTVREHKDTLLEPAKQAAQEMGEQLKPAAQQAVEEVKSTAQDAAATVKDEGQSAAQDVKGQAQQSKETVQTHATSS
jgi:gas vesicle protein